MSAKRILLALGAGFLAGVVVGATLASRGMAAVEEMEAATEDAVPDPEEGDDAEG